MRGLRKDGKKTKGISLATGMPAAKSQGTVATGNLSAILRNKIVGGFCIRRTDALLRKSLDRKTSDVRQDSWPFDLGGRIAALLANERLQKYRFSHIAQGAANAKMDVTEAARRLSSFENVLSLKLALPHLPLPQPLHHLRLLPARYLPVHPRPFSASSPQHCPSPANFCAPIQRLHVTAVIVKPRQPRRRILHRRRRQVRSDRPLAPVTLKNCTLFRICT